MRDLLTILLLIVAVGCRNNQKQPIKTINNQPETTKQATKKIHNNYHEFDTIPFSVYLNDPNIDSSIRSYCQGKFHITVDDNTIRFLEILSKKNDKYFQLYFSVFNNILANSDGAVAELMGPYCFKFVINYPNEVLRHFIENSHDLYLYTMFLGSEFYFKSGMTSDIKYNLKDFKNYMTNKLDSTNIEIKNITRIFYAKLDSMILEMDLPQRQLNN
jgi:hypothetical protein